VRVNFREFGLDETATATLQGLSKRRRLAPPSGLFEQIVTRQTQKATHKIGEQRSDLFRTHL
jgi:hypothetical protein